MRHFAELERSDPDGHRAFFRQPPEDVTRSSGTALRAVALGATLYTPGIRPDLVRDVRRQRELGAASIVLCLEDSVADADLPRAEDNVDAALRELARSEDPDTLPQLFVRVRDAEHLARFADRVGPEALDVLTGIVLPKFEAQDGVGDRWFRVLDDCNAGRPDDHRLVVMPILESPSIIHRETRTDALTAIRDVLVDRRRDVLAVRIGATDLSSVYGLRRPSHLTVYDVQVLASVIGEVVNVLGRSGDGFVVAGPVWEHYPDSDRVFRTQLRSTPFEQAGDLALRRQLLLEGFDGLLREVTLDRANGLTGKTVIHPRHVPLVHAMSVVSDEEFSDAEDVLANTSGGAAASRYGNKMNEMKPHHEWAERTLLRARAFGVAAPDVTFVDLLERSLP
ncbi:ATP/GTP-binding protein [Curtobacterium citreum]|uniref:HpcH/HpaI aldolase/citrate lyase family protein n=1 Tax=Curtobacterium citreum TaxID=2036 RepID=A0ABT2HDC4_9MICO|nr:HpcH/HpaI aldolase/citrate lyase family protein [Curtobacterium citreum]MCS6521265.1 HpcH/HpaI aldolase/citrate lyase family protein [Curtobacterium citreum]TQJ28121.1 citrate lyase beta subunit [Curtobacterium citreum]GGL69361.1 ATP/GTP-binding protein [Curtobacterium citreum]